MKRRFNPAQPVTLTILVLMSMTMASISHANPPLSRGQTLYVPVYSTIFSTPRRIPFNLATTLSIRNTDPAAAITITSADYYDTKGKMVRRYVTRPLPLAPLESTDIYIPEDDAAGVAGANFIVRWQATREVNPPIVESIMIGMKSGQGISFVSSGKEIREGGR